MYILLLYIHIYRLFHNLLFSPHNNVRWTAFPTLNTLGEQHSKWRPYCILQVCHKSWVSPPLLQDTLKSLIWGTSQTSWPIMWKSQVKNTLLIFGITLPIYIRFASHWMNWLTAHTDVVQVFAFESVNDRAVRSWFESGLGDHLFHWPRLLGPVWN